MSKEPTTVTAEQRHRESVGIKNAFGSPGYKAALAATQTDVLGRPIERPSIDDIAVGWSAYHGTDRYLAGDEVDVETGTPVGTYKGGVVSKVFDREGVRRVEVIEARVGRGKHIVWRRFDWAVAELDPERTAPTRPSQRENAAKMLLAAAAENRKTWAFESDDFLVLSALALTDDTRQRIEAGRVAQAATSRCAEGHCTDVNGECEHARAHIGTCCWCGTEVKAR